ncbi:hypothetical protein Sar04_14920 [Salinispora arenicola]|uniref:DUF2690 domain-containing protein n=2 Tax=Salinispora arenicola TaxID=168697 RepID=A0ABQ4JP79_SALAC|nr:hypothetical protein Sar04_14920 [Salinispora arenicola]
MEAARVIASGGGVMIDEATLLNSGCGSKCDGKDPASFRIYYEQLPHNYYTCAEDAWTVDTAEDPIAGVELRYSSRCRTAWARAKTQGMFKVESRYLSGAHRITMTELAANWRWTAMVDDAGLLARACLRTGPPGSDWNYCTRWY